MGKKKKNSSQKASAVVSSSVVPSSANLQTDAAAERVPPAFETKPASTVVGQVQLHGAARVIKNEHVLGRPADVSAVLPVDSESGPVDAFDVLQASRGANRSTHSALERGTTIGEDSKISVTLKSVLGVFGAVLVAVGGLGLYGWKAAHAVGAYENRIANVESSIASVRDDVRSLRSELNGVDRRLATIEGRLQALENRLRPDAGVVEDAPSLAQSWGVVERLHYRGNVGVKITASEGEHYFYFRGDQLVPGRPFGQMPPADAGVNVADFSPVRRISRSSGERVLAIHRGPRVMCYALRLPRLIPVECEQPSSSYVGQDASTD